MKRLTLSALTILSLSGLAVAQDPGARRGGGRSPWQHGRGPSAARLVERLRAEIDLDAEQEARIDEILIAQEERMQEFRAQREAMREAFEAGDEERAAELREQFRARRGQRGQGAREVLDQIEPLLYEDQLDTFRQLREEFEARRDRGGMGRMRRMLQDLPDAVEMTEEQRSRFDQMLSEQRTAMRERMRERFRQAEEGGLEGAEPPAPPDFAAMYDNIFEKVAEILDEEQLDLLGEFEVEFGLTTRPVQEEERGDLLIIVAAANRLKDLSSTQKEEWRKIKREAMKASRGLSSKDKKEKAEVAAKVKAEVHDLLNEEQKAEFERNLKRLESRQKRDRPLGVRRRPLEPAEDEERSGD